MSDKADDIIIPILRIIQGDIASIKSDIGAVKDNTAKIDLRLKIVESHMTGFMSSAKYLEHEINELRGRVEALEEPGSGRTPPSGP